jgi:putative copper export protein
VAAPSEPVRGSLGALGPLGFDRLDLDDGRPERLRWWDRLGLRRLDRHDDWDDEDEPDDGFGARVVPGSPGVFGAAAHRDRGGAGGVPVAYRRPDDPPFVRRTPPRSTAVHLRPVRWGERVGAGVVIVVGVGLALALAWFVLVVLRRPEAVHPSDAVGERMDRLVVRTMLADRVLAVMGWASTVSALLVLGGMIFRGLVLAPVRRRVLAGSDARSRRERRRRRLTSHRYRAEEDLLRRAAVVGMVAGAVAIVLRTATLSDSSLFTTIVPSRLSFVATSPFGVATLLRSAGLALVGSGPSDRRNCWPGALAILGSFAVVGHPQATAAAILSPLTAAQLVHVSVVATWFGGVAFLAFDLRHRRRVGDPRGSALVVGRFSVVAGASVVAAGATGTLLAWSQIGAVPALWETAYGRAVMIKVACVGLVAATGAYNHLFLVPAVERDDDGVVAWHRLRRTATAEALIIGLGVLVATAAMTSGGL